MNSLVIFLFALTFCVIDAQVQVVTGQLNETSSEQKAGAAPKCAANGEYCQTWSDCCSQSCLSFTYKCVPLHQPVQPEVQKPPTAEEIITRFGEETNCVKDGEYCQLNSDCCSKSCLSFSYKCVKNHGLDLLHQQYPQGQPEQPKNESAISNVEDLISRFGVGDEPAKTEKPVESPEVKQEVAAPVCKKRAEQCGSNDDCCNNMKCHGARKVCYQKTRSLSSRVHDHGGFVSY